MLAALLLAGLATAAFVPLMSSSLFDDDDGLEPSAPDTGSKGDLLTDKTTQGVVYDIPAVPSETVLTSFDDETDRCSVTCDNVTPEFLIESFEDGGAAISYEVDDGPVMIRFPDLDTPPLGAIFVTMPTDDGADEVMSLAEMLQSFGTPDDDVVPLLPSDAGISDDQNEAGNKAEALTAGDGNVIDDTGSLPMDEEVLTPVHDDDTLNSLINWIYPDPATGAPMPTVIEGFSAQDDILAITLTPEAGDGPLDVQIQPSEDGEDALVVVDGQPVAIVKGNPDILPSHVHVEVQAKVTL